MVKKINDYNPNPNLRNYRRRLSEAGEDWKRVQKDLSHKHEGDKSALMLIWRTRNVDLFDYEAAEALGRTPYFIRRYTNTKFYKYLTPRLQNTPSTTYDELVTRLCLEQFDNPKWLNNSLSGLGYRAMSAATQKPDPVMWDAIEALGNSQINPIDVQIYHRIYHLYVVQKRTMGEVAEILGTSENYIRNCLMKYKLPPTTSRISAYDPTILRLYRQIRYYTPDMVRLRNGGLVISGAHNVSVTMSHAIKKRQSTRFRIEDTVNEYQWLPKVVPDYMNQSPDDYPHWTAKMEIHNTIEKRVAAIRLLNQAVKCGGKWPSHPEVALRTAMDHVMNNSKLNADYWWTVIEHYFGNEELKYYSERPSQMMHILTDAASGDYLRHNKILTSRSLTEYLYCQRLRIGYLNPATLHWTLRDTKVIGPVYDPFPGIGCLAVACRRLGIKYYYGLDDHIFNRGVENGFSDAIGECEPYAGQKVNYLISQNLPISWYPLYGKNARMWSIMNGGNAYHLKLALQQYHVYKAHSVNNSLRMVNFLPHEHKK